MIACVISTCLCLAMRRDVSVLIVKPDGRPVVLSFGWSVGRNSRSRQSFERMLQMCGLRTMRFIQSYLVGQYTSWTEAWLSCLKVAETAVLVGRSVGHGGGGVGMEMSGFVWGWSWSRRSDGLSASVCQVDTLTILSVRWLSCVKLLAHIPIVHKTNQIRYYHEIFDY